MNKLWFPQRCYIVFCTHQVQTEASTPPLAKVPSVEKVEQSMQVEINVQDKNIQTSPREEDKPKVNESVMSSDVVPPLADKLIEDIVHKMPVKVPTETQTTETETVTTVEQVTQTTPRYDNQQVSQSAGEPYEINIETSIIIPGDVAPTTSDATATVEIQKTFIIDNTQPGNVREIESSTTEKGKKSKSKKKKKQKSTEDGDGVPKPSAPAEPLEIEQEKKSKPTKVTINLTKTTVYETSNVIGKEAVRIEEVLSDDDQIGPLTPGLYSFVLFSFLYFC